MAPSGENLTQADRSRGGRNGAPNEGPSEAACRKGGHNASTSFTEADAEEMGDRGWHGNRDRKLKQYPALWEKYGDEQPKHPGGEIKEGFQQ